MARGLEVLAAAVAGKRIRPADPEWKFPGDRWLILDEKRRWFWDENHTPVGFSVNSLFTQEWDIEEPVMTFAEADAAMLAGKIVERQFSLPEDGGIIQLLYSDGSYKRRFRGQSWEGWTAWKETGLYSYDIHGTDWRIVDDPVEADKRGELPTFLQFTEFFSNDKWLPAATWKILYGDLEAVRSRWPAMFREEDS